MLIINNINTTKMRHFIHFLRKNPPFSFSSSFFSSFLFVYVSCSDVYDWNVLSYVLCSFSSFFFCHQSPSDHFHLMMIHGVSLSFLMQVASMMQTSFVVRHAVSVSSQVNETLRICFSLFLIFFFLFVISFFFFQNRMMLVWMLSWRWLLLSHFPPHLMCYWHQQLRLSWGPRGENYGTEMLGDHCSHISCILFSDFLYFDW